MAWTLLDQAVGVQHVLTRTAYKKALAELKDSLAITFADRKQASYFRETVKAKHPQLAELTSGYKQEIDFLRTWLSAHPVSELESAVKLHNRDLAQLMEDSKKSASALFNNVSTIEGIVDAAIKDGYACPSKSVEEAPGAWLDYVTIVETEVHKRVQDANWLARLSGSHNDLVREAKKIEKRSREGWPTILLHAKNSLALQQRFYVQRLNTQRLIEEAMAAMAAQRKHEERLGDLLGMGEEGYVMAHASDKAAMELSQCLDTAMVGSAVVKAWAKYHRLKTHENHLVAISEILLDWTTLFSQIENLIVEDDRVSNTERSQGACTAIHDACTRVRRTVAVIQQWITALNNMENSSEGLLESGYTDAYMRNLVKQSHASASEAARIYRQ